MESARTPRRETSERSGRQRTAAIEKIADSLPTSARSPPRPLVTSRGSNGIVGPMAKYKKNETRKPVTNGRVTIRPSDCTGRGCHTYCRARAIQAPMRAAASIGQAWPPGYVSRTTSIPALTADRARVSA